MGPLQDPKRGERGAGDKKSKISRAVRQNLRGETFRTVWSFLNLVNKNAISQ
jgi:hypothetical protein